MLKALLLGTLLCSQVFAASMPYELGPEGGRFNRLHIYRIEKMLERKLSDKAVSPPNAEELKIIQMILANGKKASKWIEVVNAGRPADQQLDLSNPAKTGGIPITAPQLSNTEIMLKRYQDFLNKTSPFITDVITDKAEMTAAIPVSEEEFVKALRLLDRIYQSTIRWAGSIDWLDYMEKRSIDDMRGYILLKEIPDLEGVLKSYPTMSSADQTLYTNLLLQLCRNGKYEMGTCKTILKQYVKSNTLLAYYNQYKKYGKKVFDNFFTIQKTRPEIFWNPERTILTTPFQKPERSDVEAWMKENVEDEWKTPNFNLVFDFQPATKNIPRIQFEEGTTANVNRIAGDLITMEAEYPINSLDMKWTIRHEYGHVLGFQDCYLEFYDSLAKVMVYYEIDVNNIMCSMNGHINASNIEQLQNAYK